MTSIFHRIRPAQKFNFNARHIAHILKIRHLFIVKIERWAYVLFVHRRDKGGQFVSYRQLNRWVTAIAHMIQLSPSLEDLRQIGQGLHQESVQFEDRYSESTLDYLRQLWAERRDWLRSSLE